MSTFVNHANLFDEPGIPIIATNTQGIMGAGIAGQYAKLDPAGYHHYRERCLRGDHKMGSVMMVKGQRGYAICFPTMAQPGQRSRLDDIKAGAKDLAAKLDALPDTWHGSSILIPPLGCGIGRLPHDEVLHAIASKLAPLEDRFTFLYFNFT